MELIGPLIGAAGSALGGLAGQALLGKPPNFAADQHIPSILNATVKPATKGGNDAVNVPQVDSTQQMAWLGQAADQQDSYYKQGLQFYTKAMDVASQEMKQGFKLSNQTLDSLSYAGKTAMNQYMSMLGLEPQQMTNNSKDLLKDSLSQKFNMNGNLSQLDLSNISGADELYKGLNSLIDRANEESDPVKRQQIKAQIQSLTDSSYKTLSDPLNEKMKAVKSTLDGYIAPTNDDYLKSPEYATLNTFPGSKYSNVFNNASDAKIAGQNAENNFVNRKKNEYAAAEAQNIADQKAAIQSQLNGAKQFGSTLQDFNSTFADTYTDQRQHAFTGDEAANVIKATPGYEFQANQGTQAISRQGAAKGMLGSGNTLVALQDYGQQLAQNYYGMYMDNLSNIIQQGSQGTMAIAQNQASLGQNLATMAADVGSKGYQTYNSIGDAYAASLNNKAQMYNANTQFNAKMQYDGIQAEKGRDSQEKMAAMGAASSGSNAAQSSAAGNSMAQLNWAKFNYGVAQNQQAGSSFYG